MCQTSGYIGTRFTKRACLKVLLITKRSNGQPANLLEGFQLFQMLETEAKTSKYKQSSPKSIKVRRKINQLTTVAEKLSLTIKLKI